MSAVDLTIGGQLYNLQCDDGQEAELRQLAGELSERLEQLNQSFGTRAESLSAQNLRLVIVNLMMLGEMKEARMKNRQRAGRDREEIESMIADTLERIAGKLERLV